MNNLLLSDLICLYIEKKENKYLKEIEKRMLFSGFTKDEIFEFIDFEMNIICNRKKKYDKSLLDKRYIIGKKDKNKIFDVPEKYMYNPESLGDDVLMISETIVIIDEAIFVSYTPKLLEYKSSDEILAISKENEGNWLFFEFFNRLEYICRCANKIDTPIKSSIYADKIGILYDNEMQLCLLRWKNVDISSKRFEPYSDEYFL